VEDYMEELLNAVFKDGVMRQVAAFRRGFDKVFPIDHLNAFRIAELSLLLGGVKSEQWTKESLMNIIKADHGYTLESREVQDLILIMTEFTAEEQRVFIRFCTGSPQLPLGGK
jgi:E3 ubiquitin-protein ligase TRIP12